MHPFDLLFSAPTNSVVFRTLAATTRHLHNKSLLLSAINRAWQKRRKGLNKWFALSLPSKANISSGRFMHSHHVYMGNSGLNFTHAFALLLVSDGPFIFKFIWCSSRLVW